MSTDYAILMQKFNNFKAFVAQVAPNRKVIGDYENMSDSEFMLFGLGFLLPNKARLEVILAQMCEKLGIVQADHRDKLLRYLQCFCEYLEQLNAPDVLNTTIAQVACEQGITVPPVPPCATSP
jgi:hypothetical protein